MFSSPLHTCEATPVVRTRSHHPFKKKFDHWLCSLARLHKLPATVLVVLFFFIQKKPMEFGNGPATASAAAGQ
jgi:hypothetical protein